MKNIKIGDTHLTILYDLNGEMLLNRDASTIVIGGKWADEQENSFVATRKALEWITHLFWHKQNDDHSISDECDEDWADPDYAQAYKFANGRAKLLSRITSKFYSLVYMLIESQGLSLLAEDSPLSIYGMMGTGKTTFIENNSHLNILDTDLIWRDFDKENLAPDEMVDERGRLHPDRRVEITIEHLKSIDLSQYDIIVSNFRNDEIEGILNYQLGFAHANDDVFRTNFKNRDLAGLPEKQVLSWNNDALAFVRELPNYVILDNDQHISDYLRFGQPSGKAVRIDE